MLRQRCTLGRASAVVLCLAIWGGLFFGPGLALAQDKPGLEEAELRRQLQIERAARKALSYQSDMRKAAQLAETEDWTALIAILDGYRPAAGETDLRSWEWHFLQSLVLKKQRVDCQDFVFQGPSAGVHQLAWSGNGERLAAVGEEGEVFLWDAKAGKDLRRLGGKARWLAWDRDGHRLTISAENHTVTLWDADTGLVRRFFGPIKGLYNFRQPAFSPDGQRLALPVDKATVAIFDAANGKELDRLAGHQGLVSVVVWDSAGKTLATGSDDGTIRIWDAATGNAITTLTAGGDVVGLEWGTDARHIAAVVWPKSGTRQVRIWDVDERERVFTADNPGGTYRPNQRRVALVRSPDGKRVAAESMEGVSLWDTASARPTFQGTMGASQLNGCDPELRRWAFLETVGTRATCRVLDIETTDELLRVDVEIPMNRYQSALAWSPDGRRLAAGFSQGKVYVYAVPKDRSDVRIFNTGRASFFEWGPDGKRFAYSTGGEVRVGTLPSTAPPIRLGSPLLLPSIVNLSPDGKFLAGADRDGSVPIWDVASGKITQRLPGHPTPIPGRLGAENPTVSGLLWSPDGKRLATVRGSDGGLRVWDVNSGKVLTAFQFGGREVSIPLNEALPLAWSRDGRFLAVRTGWGQKRVRVLDVTTGKQTREWDGVPDLGSSNAMAWDSTGKKLATCVGNPPRIQIWDVTTGEEALVLKDQVLGLRAMSWSPDGRWLAYRVDTWKISDLTGNRSLPLTGTGELAAWKPDGSQLALVGERNDVLRFYDAATGNALPSERGFASPNAIVMRLRSRMGDASNYHLQSLVWNEQGLRAAADAMPYPGAGALVVWDVRTGMPHLTLGQAYDALAGIARVARKVAWAPDGRSLATLAGSRHDGGRIDIWDAATGKKTQTLAGGRINFRDAADMAWSPDGRSLAFAAEGIQVWTLANPGEPLKLRQSSRTGTEADHTFLAWSADGRSLAVLECLHTLAREAVLTAWDLGTGQERFTWKRPYEFCYLHAPVAWSPDGKRVAWAGPTPAVWDVAASKEEFPLAGHSSPVIDVEWSADGRRVMSRSEVFTGFTRSFELKVWDTATRQEVLMLRGPMAGWLVAPGFRGLAPPPGRGSEPGDVVVWDLSPRN